MKKSRKGDIISTITILAGGFIEVRNKEGELMKLTHAQRSIISSNIKKNQEEFKTILKKAFNNVNIVDDTPIKRTVNGKDINK